MSSFFKYSLIFSLLILGCDLYPQDDYQEYVVVESFLIADEPLSEIFISTTAPTSQEYKFKDLVISNANVVVNLLEGGQGSAVQSSFSYSLGVTGSYMPIFPHTVLPARTYQLKISIPNRDDITATTTTPNRFTNQNTVPDSIIYLSQDRIELKIPPSAISEDLKYFIFTTMAHDATFENLVPTFKDLLGREDDPTKLQENILRLSINNSGIISEGNFETEADGSLLLRYPWIGIAFFGDNTIVAHILDKNSYDFIRSQNMQLGGGSFSAGEIPNVIYNIDGAVGVFGSFATDTLQTKVLRQSRY
ncbi:MAG: DUF4249 family protein [Balneolaceae bacterium]